MSAEASKETWQKEFGKKMVELGILKKHTLLPQKDGRKLVKKLGAKTIFWIHKMLTPKMKKLKHLHKGILPKKDLGLHCQTLCSDLKFC